MCQSCTIICFSQLQMVCGSHTTATSKQQLCRGGTQIKSAGHTPFACPAMRIEGVTVLYPASKASVAFVRDSLLAAGAKGDNGAMCLIVGNGSDATQILAAPGGSMDPITCTAIVGEQSSPELIVAACQDELLAYSADKLEQTAQLFRASLPIRSVSVRPGTVWA